VKRNLSDAIRRPPKAPPSRSKGRATLAWAAEHPTEWQTYDKRQTPTVQLVAAIHWEFARSREEFRKAADELRRQISGGLRIKCSPIPKALRGSFARLIWQSEHFPARPWLDLPKAIKDGLASEFWPRHTPGFSPMSAAELSDTGFLKALRLRDGATTKTKRRKASE
jgi:hypothetical protein